MKRIISVFSMMLIVGLSGCEEELETSELVFNDELKAEIKLYLFAELDKESFGMQPVPDGTKVTFAISNHQFNPAATGLWTETVESVDGIVIIEVPVVSSGVQVNVRFPSFVADQKQTATGGVESVRTVFSRTNAYIDVLPNESVENAFNYSSQRFQDAVEYANLVLHVNADLDRRKAGYEPVPDGTFVYVNSSNNWNTRSQVKDGQVDIDIPVSFGNNSVYVQVYFDDFIYDQIQLHTNNATTVKKHYINFSRNYSLPVNKTSTVVENYTNVINFTNNIEMVTVNYSNTTYFQKFDTYYYNRFDPGTVTGKVIVFRDNGNQYDFSQEVDVVNGTFSVSVPANVGFNIRYVTTIDSGKFETPWDSSTDWITESSSEWMLQAFQSGFQFGREASYYNRTITPNTWSYNNNNN